MEVKRTKIKLEYSFGVLDVKPVRIGNIQKIDHRVKKDTPSKFKGSTKMIVWSRRLSQFGKD